MGGARRLIGKGAGESASGVGSAGGAAERGDEQAVSDVVGEGAEDWVSRALGVKG